MPPRHRKTRRTYNEPGHAHLLTFSCEQRWPLLVRDGIRRLFLEAVDRTRRRQDVALLAYVIMPEHAHLLVWPRRSEYRIDEFLYSVKRPVSFQVKQLFRAGGSRRWLDRLTVRRGKQEVFRFWLAGGGHDRNLVRREQLWPVIDYLHANPVRRGMVARPTDWPWSSARYWLLGDRSVLEMDSIDA